MHIEQILHPHPPLLSQKIFIPPAATFASSRCPPETAVPFDRKPARKSATENCPGIPHAATTQSASHPVRQSETQTALMTPFFRSSSALEEIVLKRIHIFRPAESCGGCGRRGAMLRNDPPGRAPDVEDDPSILT